MKMKLVMLLFSMGMFYAQSAWSDACSDYQDACDKSLKTRLATCDRDYTGGGLDRCKRAAVKEWTICWDQSDFQCDGTTSRGRILDDGAKPCPPGSRRNPLGICVAYFKPRELPPGKDGCPAGEERGPDDRCVPSIKVKAIPFADGYMVACPKGMKPSPVDGGCVMNDVGEVERDNETGRDCPEGMQPGPNGDCVPIMEDLNPKRLLNQTLSTLLKRAAAGYEALPTEQAQDLSPQLFYTREAENLVNGVAEQLDAERVEVEPQP